MNIPSATINIFLGFGFGLCLFLAIRELPTWQTKLKWLGTVFLSSAATGALLFFADNHVIAQVNAGNPWFRPVLGYAFPVFLVNILGFVGIWVWYTRQNSCEA